MPLSYSKNKVHIQQWRKNNRAAYNEYQREYRLTKTYGSGEERVIRDFRRLCRFLHDR